MDCSCGKMWTASYADALRQFILEGNLAAGSGHKPIQRTVYFYQCAEGTWHWSRMYVPVEDCTCFEKGYLEYETVWKRCDTTRPLRKREKHFVPRTTKLPYQCAGGRWHIQLVEGRKQVEKCRCGMWGFNSEELAHHNFESISKKFPQNKLMYLGICNFRGWHLYNTRAYKEFNSDARARYRGGVAV